MHTEHHQQVLWCAVRSALFFPVKFPYKQLAGEKESKLRQSQMKKIACLCSSAHDAVNLQVVERLKDLLTLVLSGLAV